MFRLHTASRPSVKQYFMGLVSRDRPLEPLARWILPPIKDNLIVEVGALELSTEKDNAMREQSKGKIKEHFKL